MKNFYITILLAGSLALASCAGLDLVETRIMNQDGEQLLAVESKRDALVLYEREGEKITVDNRGQPGAIRTIVDAWLLRTINN